MPGVIVGIDGSGHSQRALEWAVKDAATHHTPLTVITVHQAVASFFDTPEVLPRDRAETEHAREAAQKETDEVLAKLGEARPESVAVKAVHGFPGEVLVDASADADLMVLGLRGQGGFARLLIGSVTFQVAQHARCPVVIVRGRDAK